MSSPMTPFEAIAFARMLDQVVARHLRTESERVPLRLPRVSSYLRLAAILEEWVFTPTAVLLFDSGPAIRVGSVAHLQERELWPPRGVLVADDATWMLEPDGRVTRLY